MLSKLSDDTKKIRTTPERRHSVTIFKNIIGFIKEKKNVIVFGDLALDKYTEVSTTTLSSATFTPVMVPDKKCCYLGCAGNVAKIINEFNCKVFLISAIGKNQHKLKIQCLCLRFCK